MKAVVFALLAQAALGAHAAQVRPLDAWAPPGWRQVAEASGDLDRDGDVDEVRLFQAQDPARIRQHFMRNSGEGEEVSTNHLTGRRKPTQGLNELHPEEAAPAVTWDRVATAPRYLEQVTWE